MNSNSAHGCITCSVCGGACPICGSCRCKKDATWPPQPYTPFRPLKPLQGQKCDICGSTAIDHTEMNCQMNRFNKRTQVNDLASNNSKPKQSAANPPKGEATQMRPSKPQSKSQQDNATI